MFLLRVVFFVLMSSSLPDLSSAKKRGGVKFLHEIKVLADKEIKRREQVTKSLSEPQGDNGDAAADADSFAQPDTSALVGGIDARIPVKKANKASKRAAATDAAGGVVVMDGAYKGSGKTINLVAIQWGMPMGNQINGVSANQSITIE